MENGTGVVSSVGDWLAVNGIRFLIDLLVVVLIIAIGKLIIDWACRALRTALQKTGRVNTLLENFIASVVSKVLWILVLLVAVQRFGVEVGPFIAGLGVTGFIVGFAFQESLGNLASGMMIALNAPFKVGDFVEIGGNSGVVKEMNMMATTLTTPDNKKIVVPNKNVWGSPITNYTAMENRRVDISAGIAYGADIRKAKEVILGVLKDDPDVLDDPAPMVEVTAMADSSINLTVRPWCKTENYWSVFFRINQAVKEALDNAGIEIPFPQMDIHHHGLEALKS